MNERNFLLGVGLAVLFVSLGVISAQAIQFGRVPGETDVIPEGTPLSDNSVSGLVLVLAAIVEWIYYIFFTVAAMIFLFVAYQYLFSSGDAAAIQKVHQWLIYGLIAVVVALLAVGFSVIIQNFLKGNGGGEAAGGSYGTYGPSMDGGYSPYNPVLNQPNMSTQGPLTPDYSDDVYDSSGGARSVTAPPPSFWSRVRSWFGGSQTYRPESAGGE